MCCLLNHDYSNDWGKYMYSFDKMEDMMHTFEDTWEDYDWEEFYEEPVWSSFDYNNIKVPDYWTEDWNKPQKDEKPVKIKWEKPEDKYEYKYEEKKDCKCKWDSSSKMETEMPAARAMEEEKYETVDKDNFDKDKWDEDWDKWEEWDDKEAWDKDDYDKEDWDKQDYEKEDLDKEDYDKEDWDKKDSEKGEWDLTYWDDEGYAYYEKEGYKCKCKMDKEKSDGDKIAFARQIEGPSGKKMGQALPPGKVSIWGYESFYRNFKFSFEELHVKLCMWNRHWRRRCFRGM